MLRETSAEAAYAEFQKQAPILSDDEEAPDADGSEQDAKAATPAPVAAAESEGTPGTASAASETTSVAAAPTQPKSTDAIPAGTTDEKLLLKMFVSLQIL